MEQISKSHFKPHALEIMRRVEQTGQAIVITDHGRPVLELRPWRAEALGEDPVAYLKNTVIDYIDPQAPLDEAWDADA